MYNTILDGMLKAEKYEEALKLYECMKENKVKRSNATYSIIIKVYSKLNDVTKAVEIYNEMLEFGIKPSLLTYTSILQILIKSKRITNAIEIFDEIINNEMSPDHVMYNVIINGCVFNGRLQDACRFLTLSFKANLKLCDDVYRNVLNNLLTNKIMDFSVKVDTTIKICKELKSRGLKIEYDLYYKVMKMVYKSNGKKADAFAQKETDEYAYCIEKNSYNQTNNNYYNNNKNYNKSYNNYNNYSDNSVYNNNNNNQSQGRWKNNK